MLSLYFCLIIACGIVTGTQPSDYTPAERARVLGPFADSDVRIDFPCQNIHPSPQVPTSVHQLRPADIKYVCAIGDSLTAASGGDAGSIFGMLTEYRGVAWSIGGAQDLSQTITLPNILRKCNSDVYGYSIGNGNQNSKNARFNVARPGGISNEMPGQATMLVDRMIGELGQAEFESSWKLITVFIGANDLCDYCNDETGYSPEAYVANVKGALDIFKARMPRTFVNLVLVLNVAELEDLHAGLVCQGVQFFLCKCAINANTREIVRAATVKYQQALKDLIDSGDYDTADDFTVVYQPFMEHMTVPITPEGLPDFSYFTYDCFHFSKKGHGAAAIELWNNMMEPVGKKTTLWNLVEKLHCPPEPHGFIYTSKNSGL